MWTKNGNTYTTHSAIRHAMKGSGKSLPAVLTDDLIASFGFTAITQTPKPEHNALSQVAEWEVVNDAQVWTVRDKTAQELATMRAGMQVSKRQAALALLDMDLLDGVPTAIASITDATMRKRAEIEWDTASVVDRISPIVALIQPLWSLTDAQLDELFALAATK